MSEEFTPPTPDDIRAQKKPEYENFTIEYRDGSSDTFDMNAVIEAQAELAEEWEKISEAINKNGGFDKFFEMDLNKVFKDVKKTNNG